MPISTIKRKYGLTKEEYNELLKKQKSVCAICGKVDNRIMKGTVVKLNVDHCHKTGKVRGLLCNRCNSGLGLLKDDINLLNKAILYLKQNEKE